MRRGTSVVVGADGVVGTILARALGAVPVVHRAPTRPGELAIGEAGELVASASLVVNSQGLRPRPGLSAEEIDLSHGPATERLVEQMSPGAVLVHVSSASVLGLSRGGRVSATWPAAPESFPIPEYALSKWRAERIAILRGGARGLKVIVLRPAIVYQHPAEGMLGTLTGLARDRRVVLRLLPSGARHHLCSAMLLSAVARAVASAPERLAHGERLTVADPFVVTNSELRHELCAPLAGRWRLEVPVSSRAAHAVLGRLAGLPGFDFRPMAEAFGVMGMDVRYEAELTFNRLGLDASQFSRERTWSAFVAVTAGAGGTRESS